MTNIIKFPQQHEPAVEVPEKAVAPVKRSAWSGIRAIVIKGIWVIAVLSWPILKWVFALDCVYQLARTVYYWDTPGVYAGWTFMLHFVALTALTYFVSVYRPK